MTTPMGRRSVSYLATCALGSGQTLTKADQTGKNHNFSGSMGLAPGWLNGPPSAQDEINVSACMLARMNSAGMHVPIWMDSGAPGDRLGPEPRVPRPGRHVLRQRHAPRLRRQAPRLVLRRARLQEGARAGPSGRDRRQRLLHEPWGSGALCDDHCTKYGSDGYTSCNGVSNPVTVWRQASYNPAFDDNYIYKLVNVKSKMVLDVSGGYTGENGSIVQWYEQRTGRTSTAGSSRSPPASGRSSRCRLGKVVTDRNGSSANVMTNSYNGTSTDNWAIDDHNGHFIIRNKSTNGYLRSMDSDGASRHQRHHELQRRPRHRLGPVRGRLALAAPLPLPFQTAAVRDGRCGFARPGGFRSALKRFESRRLRQY